MKGKLFTVYFSDGRTSNEYALTPLEAAILAQSDSFRLGHCFQIDSIQNEESGAIYLIEQKIKTVNK